MSTLVLLPDAQYEDEAEIEREVLGESYEMAVYRERSASGIPDGRWRAADALIVYHEVPIDRTVVDRLERCRIVVRAGVVLTAAELAARP